MSENPQWPFSILPWQSEPWDRLCRSLESGGLPHALLLIGAEHIGKCHLARAFAALLLCESPSGQAGCGLCRTCNLLSAGSHTDFKEVEPLEDSRQIRIDQVREVIDFANKTASLGQRKVILLHPAEAMNVNAANALLKCLEEPAANTHLLLVSHRPSALPATIRSRCQSFSLPAPTEEIVLQWLDAFSGDEILSKQLLQSAAGKPMVARALLEGGKLQSRQAIKAGLEALESGQISALEFPPIAAELELREVLASMQHYLEAAIRARSSDGHSPGRDCFMLLDDLGRLHRSVLKGGNPNRQLTIEDAAGRLARVL